VLRLDADEFFTPSLAEEIQRKLASLPASVHGVYVTRQVTFMGKLIRFGTTSPIRVLRIFRHGAGRCENRWMDEHIKVDGATVGFDGRLIDDKLNSVSWWIDKHNRYASREVVDLMNMTHRFMAQETVAELAAQRPDGLKRWLKEKVYARLPAGHRVLLYFLYRYFLRLGFLDGARGTAFHFLQGYWYRYLVDIKLMEVTRRMREKGIPPKAAIREVLGIDLGGDA
jgi:hypothetical protein